VDQHVQQPDGHVPTTSAAARPPRSSATEPATRTLTYSNGQSPGATPASPTYPPITDQLPRHSGRSRRPPAKLRVLACASHVASLGRGGLSFNGDCVNRINGEQFEEKFDSESSSSSSEVDGLDSDFGDMSAFHRRGDRSDSLSTPRSSRASSNERWQTVQCWPCRQSTVQGSTKLRHGY